ncbi:MAG: archease [Candidatus Aenigmatarchaeota archaeon]|nr:MAG: archease [Candidatus Aenigmarchaeota archaeon ex4484_14]RLI96962.1 MAG: archease [Candidatus Aenigmarchaeota archaeon]
MEKRYEFLDIATADRAFAAFGNTLEQAFANAALAMTEIITDTSKINKKMERKIHVEAQDDKALLYDWLSEILFIFDTEHVVFGEFVVTITHADSKWILDAVARGEVLARHEIRGEVKAITYHKMEIKKTDDGYRVQVIVDT